ncbi:unnamed protein product [Orchesella dallaii]|uniref:Uncharacterized protein n=1 Tax=Orchesella dallaii TaxID=48710 RepID=A0ABP1Q9A7_9HEXA
MIDMLIFDWVPRSPLPISGNGKIAVGSSGKSSSVGGKSNSEAMEGGKSEQISSPTGQLRANSEVPEENDNTQQQQHQGHGGSSKQSMFRQCFSLDESALLGFSIKSVNEGRIPLFEKWADMASGESCSASIMEDELSFLSAKKREQCLKVYEKMKKTGCEIKLDTIFRGMLTPSEYRAFMRAAENAAQEAEEAEKAKKVSEDQVDEENVGNEQHDAKSADVKEVLNKK